MTDEIQQQESAPRAWTLTILTVGLAVGFLVYGVREQTWLYVWRFGLTEAFLLGGLALILSAGPGRWRLPTLFAMALAGAVAALAISSIDRFGHDTPDYHPSLIAGSILISLVTLTFFQTWHEARGRRAAEGNPTAWRGLSYERLFGHIWETLLVVAVSFCFLGLVWLLLWLFASLFESVGVAAFNELIEESYFAWPVSCGAFALSIHFTREHKRIVAALRSIVFTLFSVLAPVFLVLSASFLMALFLGGFERLTSLVSASTTLLVLTGFGLVFVNAVIRDGQAADRQHALVRTSALLLVPSLFFFCGFAVYAIGLRIEQYGLTPDRIFVAIITALLTLTSFAYLAALLARSRWMIYCRRANVALALVVAVVAVVLQTPLADPYRLSAESQYRRLAAGTADAATFDYGFLRYKLGNAGKAVLERIAKDSGVAPQDVVAEQLARLAGTSDFWEWWGLQFQDQRAANAQEALADRQRVRRIPASLELPEDLSLNSLNYWSRGSENCGAEKGKQCLITAVDITDQPGHEFLLAYKDRHQKPRLVLLERIEGGSDWQVLELEPKSDADALWSALLDQDFEPVPPIHRDLRIGAETIRLHESGFVRDPLRPH